MLKQTPTPSPSGTASVQSAYSSTSAVTPASLAQYNPNGEYYNHEYQPEEEHHSSGGECEYDPSYYYTLLVENQYDTLVGGL